MGLLRSREGRHGGRCRRDGDRQAVWDAGAGRDPRQEALDIEAAIRNALARNTRLHNHRITVTAGPDGLVTLTGSVPTQDLRREVELACWTLSRGQKSARQLLVGH